MPAARATWRSHYFDDVTVDHVPHAGPKAGHATKVTKMKCKLQKGSSTLCNVDTPSTSCCGRLFLPDSVRDAKWHLEKDHHVKIDETTSASAKS